MIIPATYNYDECYINTNYIIDIFPTHKGIYDTYTAFVLDDCREGYIISKEVFEEWKEQENKP